MLYTKQSKRQFLGLNLGTATISKTELGVKIEEEDKK